MSLLLLISLTSYEERGGWLYESIHCRQVIDRNLAGGAPTMAGRWVSGVEFV
jgi:hypothetical protein